MAKSIVCGAILMAVMAALSAHGAFDVRDFGAKGDGDSKDTAAVQKAIDAAHAAGGGEVLLEKGVYICGSVFLRSGVDFHLAEGAVLKGSPDREDYNALDVAPQNWGGLGSGDNISGGHLILCVEQENVTLRGPGRIDGNVASFLKMPDGSHPPGKLKIPWRPAQMIWFAESRNVAIRDVEIADAPYWSCFIYGCEGVVVERANIHTVRSPHTYNGDGLDIDSSRHVRVAGCSISTADDSITLRAAGQGHLKNVGPCEDVVVSNCTLSSDCNAIRLGVGNGAIRNCSFSDIRIENTRYAVNAVGAWSRPEHGVDISNVSFRDMEIDAKGFCKFYYKHATDSVFDGIAFRHVRGKVREPSIFDDSPARPFRNLVFEDVSLKGETSPRIAAGDVDWPKLNAAAREQAKTPIREGVPGVRPFWNAHAKAFIHPPAFEFKATEGMDEYRFALTADSGDAALRTWTAAKPWTPIPSDFWDSLAPGYYTLKVEGSGERRFYRAAVFQGPYPRRVRGYREAAQNVYAAVYNMPQVQGWKTSDDPPEGYDLYCYPAKILGSMIRALCRHAKAKPQDAKAALAISRKMADWLVAHSQPSDAPLAHFPPTYWGDRRSVSVEYAGQNMLRYPAFVALAYCELAAATGDEKYRKAALSIARTYVRLQGGDGTWPLKVFERDGSPVRANRLVPDHTVLCMFDKAFAATSDAAFRDARERAFAYVLKRPATTWNWDGQFEDIDPRPPYENLQKGDAVDAALRLFELGRRAEACEIVDWCEDQFVVWSDPVHNMDWRNWKTPTALEQYEYYTPIDASMGDMICAFSAAYKATGDLLYLEKAKALADNITRNQRGDGTIPTYFDSRSGSDWVNCMVRAAESLEMLSEIAVTP